MGESTQIEVITDNASSIESPTLSVELLEEQIKPTTFTAKRVQILPVHGMRVLLGYLILLLHIFKSTLNAFIHRNHFLGGTCVAVYFIMAGYFAYVSLQSRRTTSRWRQLGSFYAARLIPVSAVIVLSCLFCLLAEPAKFPWRQIYTIKGNPFINHWFVYFGQSLYGRLFWPNLSLWYLSVQMLFWVITPILAPPMKYLKWWMCILLISFCILADFGIFFAYPTHVMTQDLAMGAYFSPSIGINKHLEGMLLAKLVQEVHQKGVQFDTKTRQLVLSLMVELGFFVAGCFYFLTPDFKGWMWPHAQEPSYFVHPGFLPAFAAWALVNVPKFSVVSRLLGSRWCRSVAPGAVSLVIYGIHIPYFKLVDGTPGQLTSLTSIFILGLSIERTVMVHIQNLANKI